MLFIINLAFFVFLVWAVKIPMIASLVYKFFPPKKMYDTPTQITERSLPYETHSVTTEDGYILKIFRTYKTLPVPGEVVLLQHGLMGNSTDWLLFDDSIAFQLVDSGWDVWLGNHRGNEYSQSHLRHSYYSRQFWQFSFHELGCRDLPAMIDHILTTTQAKQIVYIGHSQGCTAFFAMASLIPEMNRKIKAAFALAPVYGVRHCRYRFPTLYRIAALDRLGPGKSFLNALGIHKIGGFQRPRPIFQPFADMFLDIVVCPIANLILRPTFLKSNCNYPHPDVVKDCFEISLLLRFRNGVSILQLRHFSQSLCGSCYFCFFDYGRRENLRIYGHSRPPIYDVRNITTHVSLVWGEDDDCVVSIDLKTLYDRLANKSQMRVPRYKHMDFTASDKYTGRIVRHVISTTSMLTDSGHPADDVGFQSESSENSSQ